MDEADGTGTPVPPAAAQLADVKVLFRQKPSWPISGYSSGRGLVSMWMMKVLFGQKCGQDVDDEEATLVDKDGITWVTGRRRAAVHVHVGSPAG